MRTYLFIHRVIVQCLDSVKNHNDAEQVLHGHLALFIPKPKVKLHWDQVNSLFNVLSVRLTSHILEQSRCI